GFYPVCPGTPYYILGAPSFKEITIHLENGNKFKIEANKLSKENYYIQSATLNGKPFDRSWISHEEILSGAALTFEIGPAANKNWASNELSLPLNLMGR
ncbi:MAG: glycoside hydrolase family 92 protein, partial [Cyclobacteriaceae bacterium]|nr:glycoside hydrolase family 92 protein [Cyclobacteriaceae bacterium]